MSKCMQEEKQFNIEIENDNNEIFSYNEKDIKNILYD